MNRVGLLSLSGRRVLVSGGTAGIGLATCRHLLEAGAKVFTFSRHDDHVAQGRERLSKATVGQGDQGHLGDLTRLFDEAEATLGGLDAVVVNAGIGGSSVMRMETTDWVEVMNVNLVGPMHLAALAASRLKGGGHTVFIGSLSAKTRSEGGDVYVASKSGLRGFVDSYGRGVGERNVSATLIEPGLVQSDMTAGGHPHPEEEIAQAKMILADDVARAVLYALSQPPRVTLPLLQIRPRMQLI